jgi:DHA2 family multidrug resistance protein-like MFS transporter
MLAIALGITMAVLDSAIANVALPTIARQLHCAPAESIWIINAYQLATVVSLLPLAALGDIIGYRRVYTAGLVVFTLASVGCALSHNLESLVAFRLLQGLGAAGASSVNGALVRYTYPLRLLGRGIGLNALVVSLAAALGPTIASAILSVGGWEWLFAVNLPIGLITIVIAAWAMPASDRSGRRFDIVSAMLNTLVFGLLFTGLDLLTHGGGHNRWIAAGELTLAAIAGVGLILREAPSARPLIPLDLMRIPIFAMSIGVSICSFMAQSAAFLALPFYFQGALHRSQVMTGLLMSPWPIAVGFSAPLAGRLSDKLSAAILGFIGLATFAIGLGLLAMLPPTATNMDIIWRMALCGLGFGFFQSPNNRTLLSSAPRTRAGAAGGMLSMARLTGMTAGATVTALFFRLIKPEPEQVCLIFAAGFASLAAISSLARWPNAKSPASAEGDAPI